MLLVILLARNSPRDSMKETTDYLTTNRVNRWCLRPESRIGCRYGVARYTHTKSQYLESKSRCRSKLSESGPRAARCGAYRQILASRTNRGSSRCFVGGLAAGLAGSTCSCRTNVLAFWSGRVGARGRGRGWARYEPGN